MRVGVVGIESIDPEVVLRESGDGLRSPAAPARRAEREDRAAGADFVGVTMHVGATCGQPGTAPEEESSGCSGSMLEVARALAEPVDLIVGGHTHRRVLTSAGGIPLVEAASYTQAYSVTDLERREGRQRGALPRGARPPRGRGGRGHRRARVVAEWDARCGRSRSA